MMRWLWYKIPLSLSLHSKGIFHMLCIVKKCVKLLNQTQTLHKVIFNPNCNPFDQTSLWRTQCSLTDSNQIAKKQWASKHSKENLNSCTSSIHNKFKFKRIAAAWQQCACNAKTSHTSHRRICRRPVAQPAAYCQERKHKMSEAKTSAHNILLSQSGVGGWQLIWEMNPVAE